MSFIYCEASTQSDLYSLLYHIVSKSFHSQILGTWYHSGHGQRLFSLSGSKTQNALLPES